MTDFTNPWIAIAALLVAILGARRLARLITIDTWPPSAHLRAWWSGVTNDGPWANLVYCHWCATPWVMLVCIAWFGLGLVLAPVLIAWWVFWGWMALSYLASIIAAYDDPAD